MRTLAAAILLVAASALVSASEGAADIDLARSRYEEAAYEDALKILDGVEASTASQRVQVEQYRALCHIALGHTEDAERAVIALVDADRPTCRRRRSLRRKCCQWSPRRAAAIFPWWPRSCSTAAARRLATRTWRWPTSNSPCS